ncbi:MAG: MBL fold metallo-hydrolase [Bacteroidia bacterium]
MNIRFLGTGGAFDSHLGNSAAWIELNGSKILLDCGHSVYGKLRALNLAGEIDYILLTHLHDDHVGSLSTTILHHKHVCQPARKARILYPDTRHGNLMKERLTAYLAYSLMQPEEYVDFIPLDNIDGITEIDTTGHHVADMVSFGFMFEDSDSRVIYSGDMGTPRLIFDEVDKFAEKDKKALTVFHETSFAPSNGIHTFYEDLMHLQEDHDVYVYHADPKRAPEDCNLKFVCDQPEFMM